MKRPRFQIVMTIVCVSILWAASAMGQEEPFPVKPINMYVGYPPGGATVITAQVTADGMKKYLNQPVVMNFKTGAVQLVLGEFLKNSKPDGYTIGYFAHQNLIAKLAKDKVDGEPVKVRLEDLDSLGAGPYSPYLLCVSRTSPWQTIEDLIAAARKSPGKLTHGEDGMWTSGHLLMELFAQKIGTSLTVIPFQGGGPAITALLGGHIDIVALSKTAFGPHIKPGGGLRPLVIFDKQRERGLPDVPTAMEKGLDITWAAWQGLRAPNGLPKSVKAKLVDAFEKTMKDPEILQTLDKLESNVVYMDPEEAQKQSVRELNLVLEVWEKANKK